jgi:predicted transcriptional regulator
MSASKNIIQILDLPPRMARQVENVIRKERRSPADLMREALRTYFWLRGLPEETPTVAELRAIRRGRAEIKGGQFVTLEQLANELESPRRKARAKRA